MPAFEYDLLVIGAGSGGVRCSRVAAGFGARVAVIEGSRVGGTCVNLGCVPKKLFAYASTYGDAFQDAQGYGWTAEGVRFDWGTLLANKDREIARLNQIYEGILDRAGVELIRGWARVVGPHEVEVGGRRMRARYIVVAVGGRPWVPDFPGNEHVTLSDDLFSLPQLPERVVVAGGGYIAVEFASIFRGLGCEVDLVYRGELFLRGFDDDARRELANELRKRGIRLHFNTVFSRVERDQNGLGVHLTDGTVVQTDLALFAVGRRPLTEGLGLREVGVQLTERGAVVVDEGFQSAVPSIYALGDVIERVQLTPVALEEGMILARNLFGGQSQRVDYRDIPTAVFSHPELAAVGLTEAQAREKHGELRIYKTLFRPMRYTLAGRDQKTFMKVIVEDATDRVLGMHVMGTEAGELVQGLAVALRCGVTKAQLDSTIGIHPTSAEEIVTMRDPAPQIPGDA